MFFLNESGNPFDYMSQSGLWSVMVVVLVVCGILLVLLRPLHRMWTDRKTRAIIDEMGGEAPEPPPDGGDDAGPQEAEQDHEDGEQDQDESKD